MRNIENINGIAGVAVGGVATLLMALERRYHNTKVFPSAMIESDPVGAPGVYDLATTDPTKIIESSKLIVNGVVIRDLTPAQAIKLAQANYGGVPVTDHIPFFFSDPTRASITGEEATSWDMFGQRTFVMEHKLRSNISNPVIKTIASYDYGRNVAGNQPFLNIVKQQSYTYNAPQGDLDIVSLPIRNPIQRIHIEPSAGTISEVLVKRDAETVFEATKAQNDAFHADYGIVSPFGFSVIFDHEQQLTSPLKVNRDLNVRPRFSTPNSANVLVESIARGYA